MASAIFYLVCYAAMAAVSGEEGGACQTFNCQLNNVEILKGLIESMIESGKSHAAMYVYIV